MSAEIITLGHGSGTGLTRKLILEIFQPLFAMPSLEDAAQVGERTIITTDSYVVKPLFFPGSDIGELAVNGTVNDLAMKGARPAFLMISMIIEEGLPMATLKKIAGSIASAARKADVKVVAGDTKVVEKGRGDGIYITSSGIGYLPCDLELSTRLIRKGDMILINGTIGDHAIAVINARNDFGLTPAPQSDCAPLHEIVSNLLPDKDIHFLRDATRGGIAAIMNEVYAETGLGIILEEERIPVRREIEAVCEMLGLDPLYLANEGKMTVFCQNNDEHILRKMRKHPLGRAAAIIGEVTDSVKGVYLRTLMGGLRPCPMIESDPLPRIC
ncbi:MAG: hydrogenase expression/formation protein HypE [Candidatus Cloacimonetes bacterium]|nr:hydrogenase expression/formation protein HypE [Candidatus Cloacimonadota bacterium]